MSSLIRKSTSKYWFACFRDHTGRQCRRSTHETNRKRAQQIAEVMEQVSRRKLNARRIREAVNEIYREVAGESLPHASIASYAASWLGQKRLETGRNTYESYVKALDKFIAFLGPQAEADLCDIERRVIVAFRDSLVPKVSIGTANHNFKVIRMFFRGAQRDGYIDVDPAEFVPTLKHSDGDRCERRPFTLPEIRRLLEVADDEWRSLIYFGIYTGQRLGDLAALTWANVDFARNELTLATRKQGKRLMIPLAPPLREHLLAAALLSDLPNASIHPRSAALLVRDGRVRVLSAQFADLLASAGLRVKLPHRSRGIGRDTRRIASDLSFHCLRHTAVSLLRDAGVSEAAAMALIGHDSVEISRHYTHIGREVLQSAAESLPSIP